MSVISDISLMSISPIQTQVIRNGNHPWSLNMSQRTNKSVLTRPPWSWAATLWTTANAALSAASFDQIRASCPHGKCSLLLVWRHRSCLTLSSGTTVLLTFPWRSVFSSMMAQVRVWMLSERHIGGRETVRQVRDRWETSKRQSDRWETDERQMRDKWETVRQVGDRWRRLETVERQAIGWWEKVKQVRDRWEMGWGRPETGKRDRWGRVIKPDRQSGISYRYLQCSDSLGYTACISWRSERGLSLSPGFLPSERTVPETSWTK